MVRKEFKVGPLLKVLVLALAVPGIAHAVPEWNLQPPVTPIARQMYDLHAFLFWICVAIFVIVFGVMFTFAGTVVMAAPRLPVAALYWNRVPLPGSVEILAVRASPF